METPNLDDMIDLGDILNGLEDFSELDELINLDDVLSDIADTTDPTDQAN